MAAHDEETKKMGEGKRWTDHWQVKLMALALLATCGLIATGATWVVNSAMDGKIKDENLDGRVRSLEEKYDEFRIEQKEQRAILEDIRREVRK